MSSLKQNFIFQIIYRIITVITPLITSPILARALGAEKIGVYSATIAFVNYFTLFALLGVENHGTRSIASSQGNPGKMQTTFWNIYAVQVCTSVIALVAYVIALFLSSGPRFLILLLQGFWILSSLFNINWFFFGIEQFKLTVTRNIIIKIITVIAIVIFIRTPSDLPLYTVIMSGDAFLSSLIVWPFLRKYIHFEKPKFSLMKNHIKPLFVLFIPILGIALFHIMDKSMLDIFSTEAEAGYYYNTDKLINIPYGVITALSVVMLPRVANEYSKKRKETVKELLRKSTELSIFLTCAIGIGIAAIAEEFVPFFFGDEFNPCIKLVYCFAPVLLVKAISIMVRSQYMIPANKDKEYTIAVVVGAAVNLVANYLLISRFNALGAVLGTLIAEFAVMVMEIIYSIKEIPFIKYIIQNVVYFFIGGIMFVVVRLFGARFDFPILFKLISMVLIGAVVFVGLCFVYWKINKNSIFHAISLKSILERRNR